MFIYSTLTNTPGTVNRLHKSKLSWADLNVETTKTINSLEGGTKTATRLAESVLVTVLPQLPNTINKRKIFSPHFIPGNFLHKSTSILTKKSPSSCLFHIKNKVY